jgi:uncharacterized repeat protein (TIGR04052 family)
VLAVACDVLSLAWSVDPGEAPPSTLDRGVCMRTSPETRLECCPSRPARIGVALRLLVLSGLFAPAALGCSDSAPPPSAAGASAATQPDAATSRSPDAGSAAAPRAITIQFKPKVLDRGFACGTSYDGLGSTHVSAEPADFRMFVQDLRLIDDEGHEVSVALEERSPWQTATVALLDFEDASGACAGTAVTNDIITGQVAPGNYRGIVFRNGVPEAENHQDPIDDRGPLQTTDLNWSWLGGFKFFVGELRSGRGAQTGAPTGGIVHVGSRACSGSPALGISCSQQNRNEVRLDDFDPASNVIVADLAGLFADSDLSGTVLCHSDVDACVAPFARLGIDWDSGASTTEQSVYRVE